MAIVSLLFFLSGFSALVYQLLWFRHLGFIFGNTVHAASTVLTAYMTGLAIGAYVSGRLAPRARRPVFVFGLLGLGIGLYALVIGGLFHLLRHVYRLAYLHVTDSLYVLTPLRFVLASLVILAPTILMGATLPLLSRAFLGQVRDFSRKLGWLYGINTVGAAIGVLAAGFVLIPSLGLRGTNAVAVAINLLAGGWAMWIGRRWTVAPGEPPAAPADAPAGHPSNPRVLLLAMAGAGFVALAFEVIWFRVLSMIFGSTTYSFCGMLGVFLLGMALGPMLFGWVADRVRDRVFLLAVLELGIGAYSLGWMYRFDAQPEFLLQYLVDHGFNWASMTAARFLIAIKLLFVPTLLMGLSFAVAAKALRESLGSAPATVGRLSAFNTAGNVLGSVAGGFVLLPWLGIERSLIALALGAAALALFLLLHASASWKIRLIPLSLIVLLPAAAFVQPPKWDRRVLASGPYFSPWTFVQDGKVALRERLRTETLLYYKEGVTATASSTWSEEETLYFSMDGKVEADTTPRGMVVQRMIGHLPLLFHPAPRRVMNLGLGAGVTLGALACHPLERVEVVEIEPATLDISRLWSNYNDRVMSRPGVTFTINDGRNHLFCTPQKYDVITSDPFEPVVGGASHLFTVDHFAIARDRLEDDGIMCQWVPMYEMSARDFLIILRSFVHVFPRSALFFTGLDTLMLGFKGEMRLDPAVVRGKFDIPAVSNSLAEVGFTAPEMILGMFIADMSRGADFIGPGPLNTDNDPVIEFSVPKSAMTYTVSGNQVILLDNFTPIPESFLEGFSEERAEILKAEHEAVRLALEANLLNDRGDRQGAYNLLLKANEIAPANPVVRNEIAVLLLMSAMDLMQAEQLSAASEQFQIVLFFNERNFWALHNLVLLAMKAGNVEFAGQMIDRGLSFYPGSPLMLILRAKYRYQANDWEGSLQDLRAAMSAAPDRSRIWKDSGLVLSAMGYLDDARAALERAQRLYDAGY